MESTGNLYDYPRESIERRKLVRQLRRSCLTDGTGGDPSTKGQADIYGCLLELEKELAGFEEASRVPGA